MPAQRDAHVVDLHRDRVAAQQAFVQQFDPRAFDEAQFQQPALKLQRVLVVMAVAADLDDDAAIAAPGLAESNGIGHDAHTTARPPRLFDSDYQVRQPSVHPVEASQPVVPVRRCAITDPATEAP